MKFVHIGWCQEDKHDKVWGVIELIAPTPTTFTMHSGYQDGTLGKYVTFWGRRGAKLQTKIVEGVDWQIDDLFRKKTKKGYKEIEEWQLDEVYPEFESDLEKTAFWATLKI